MLDGGGETGQEYASCSRPGGLGCAKHLSPLLLHADKAAALFTQRRGRCVLRSAYLDSCIAPAYRGGEWSNPRPAACCQAQDVGAVNKGSLRRESLDTVLAHRAIRESSGGGGSRKVSSPSSYLHTLPKNPHPISGVQAYIAYLVNRCVA
jgi:hypothetical protein